MYIEVGRHGPVGAPKKAEKLLVAMPRPARSEDRSRGDVERREQGRGAVPHVVVGDAFHVAQAPWAARAGCG